MGDLETFRLFDLGLTLRILIVTDGTVGFWDAGVDRVDPGFTMRGMLRALWDAPSSDYPYTRFRVDHAVRLDGQMVTTERVVPDGSSTRRWTEYRPFRFDAPGFDLRHYDEVWFFGYEPGNQTSNDTHVPGTSPLSEAEVSLIAGWMDRGGGVFATGDHGELGSWLCAQIPRVRRMRKWTYGDGVPPNLSSGRIDTTIPQHTRNGHPYAEFADQSDDVPKPLHLRRFALWDGLRILPASPVSLATFRWAPHPVLCTKDGPIDFLPDHMHEGVVNASDEVDLTGDYVVGGSTRKEFPHPNKARPQEIAWARSGGSTIEYEAHFQGEATSVQSQVVPTVATYDGEPVGLGRIVVDGTWHNFLDINVLGTSTDRSGLTGVHLATVGAYYRNIAQWLATASARDAMRNGLFIHIVANTGGWGEAIGNRFLMREMARDVLGRWSSECTRRGWLFDPWWFALALERRESSIAMLLPAEDHVQETVLAAMAEAVHRLLPELARVPVPDDGRDLDDESARGDVPTRAAAQHELVAAALSSARGEALRELVADIRASLAATEDFLGHLERAVDGGATTTAD